MDRRLLPALLVLCGAASLFADLPPGVSARFFSKRAVVWQGSTQVIPVNVANVAEADETFTASPADSSLLEVIRVPTVLQGETIGYLRVRGLRVGRTQIRLHPGEAMDVEVKADPSAAALEGVDPDRSRVRIVSPMEGAGVFGQFGVAVEVFDSPINRQMQDMFHAWDAPPGPPTSLRVQLRLPNGQLLDPVAQTAPESSPLRQYTFSVAAADMAPGPFELTALASPANVSDLDIQSGRLPVQRSVPLRLVAIPSPKPNAVWAGEAESVQGETKELLAPLRSPHYGTRQPDVINDPAASGGRTVAMTGGYNPWCMPFVVKEPGDYELFIEARGQVALGVYPTVSLYLNYSEQPVGHVRLASPKYHRLPVGGRFPLTAGPQLLTLAYRNDFNVGKEDRNLYFDRFELVRVGDTPPAPPAEPKPKPAAGPVLAAQPTHLNPPPAAAPDAPAPPPPKLTLLYPAGNANVFGADAVVARYASPEPMSWIDVLVDAQPQGLRIGLPKAGEPLLFPLLLRNLPPGQHQLAIRAADTSGRETDSTAQTINVLAQAPAVAGPYDRAIRLLDRLAFGPEPAELAAVLSMGEPAWLDSRLSAGFDTPGEQAVLNAARKRFPSGDDGNQTAARALQQWMASENPVRSRFTAWVENHFTTWIAKTNAMPKWSEHYDFARLGIAPFADLLDASAHSPAMITYLDQEKSYASKLNENYAREIMELHTLGVHGGYKQADVTALASILNGWTLAKEAALPDPARDQLVSYGGGNEAGLHDDFLFGPVLNDGKPRRVFGMQFPEADPTARYDRVRLAIEMLASHPKTAEHVCRKLAEHYVAVPAPEKLVAVMARTFMETGGDMRAVLRTMACRDEFWQAEPKLATPLDFGIRLGRLCRAAAVSAGADPTKPRGQTRWNSFSRRAAWACLITSAPMATRRTTHRTPIPTRSSSAGASPKRLSSR